MRKTIPSLGLLLALAACGGAELTLGFGIAPGQQSRVVVTDAEGLVEITNLGETPLGVVWPGETGPLWLKPSASQGRTLEGDSTLSVVVEDGKGARGEVRTRHASGMGVSLVNTVPEEGR